MPPSPRIPGVEGEDGDLQSAEAYAQWGQPHRALATIEPAWHERDAELVDESARLTVPGADPWDP
jgi:hypothetical protein